MGLAGLLPGEADVTRAVLGRLERPRRTLGVQCRYETSRPNRGNAMPESEAMRKIRRERVRKMAELLKIRYDKLRELRRPVSRRRAQRWSDPSSYAARDSNQDRDLH